MVRYRYITIPNTLFRDNPRPPLLCSLSVPFFHFFCGFIPNAVNDAAHRGRSAASAAVYWRGGAWCDVLRDVLVRQLKEKLAISSRNMNCALSQSWILVDPRFKLVPFNTVKHQHSAACCKCYIVFHRKSDIWIAFSRQQWSRVYTSDTTFTGVNVVYLGQTSCECRRISSYCSVQCWRPSQPLDTYLAGTNPSLHVDLLSWW